MFLPFFSFKKKKCFTEFEPSEAKTRTAEEFWVEQIHLKKGFVTLNSKCLY